MASSLPPSLNFLHHHPTTLSPPQLHPTTRRSLLTTTTTTLLSVPPSLLLTNPANAFDFRMTVPDQTQEEAQSNIQSHAKSLLKVKDLLMSESWKEAQKSMRRSSSLLKQDIYTIIQTKPPEERPRLRRLYSDLFNAVMRMDYAARDEDRVRVWECYEKIVLYLDDILSRV